MRGQGNVTSDIDLVVLHRSLPQAYRESFLFEGVPVEAFVNDSETLMWFAERDCKDGRPAMLGMLIEGALIGPAQENGRRFKQQAQEIFAKGPPPLGVDKVQRLRYAITDKLDDLEADRSRAELVAIGAELYPLLVELVLRGSNRWNGSGKWNARLIDEMDASLSREFEAAFLDLYCGSDAGTVVRLGNKLLEPHGGRLFAGYRSDAPAEWRSPFMQWE